MDKGLQVIGGSSKMRQHIADYILQSTSQKSIEFVKKSGWVINDFDRCFIIGNNCFGESTIEKRCDMPNQKFNIKGTLEEWQKHIGSFLEGNPFLILAASWMLGGPFMRRHNIESGGFHFYGKSSFGKTTTLDVAGSILGGDESGFLYRLNATSMLFRHFYRIIMILESLLMKSTKCHQRIFPIFLTV